VVEVEVEVEVVVVEVVVVEVVEVEVVIHDTVPAGEVSVLLWPPPLP